MPAHILPRVGKMSLLLYICTLDITQYMYVVHKKITCTYMPHAEPSTVLVQRMKSRKEGLHKLQ